MKIATQAGKIHRRVRGERREEKPLEDRGKRKRGMQLGQDVFTVTVL